jgi:hypothetical protein
VSGLPATTPRSLDPGKIVTRSSRQRGWLQAARRQTDAHREQEARPIPRSRVDRLRKVERRFSQNLQVEIEATDAYRAYKADLEQFRGVGPSARQRVRAATRQRVGRPGGGQVLRQPIEWILRGSIVRIKRLWSRPPYHG